MPLRTAQRHALPALAGLMLAAPAASYALALSGGAAQPLLPALMTLALCLVGGAFILRGLGSDSYPHAALGLCNVVTMTRGAGIAVLAGLIAAPQALAEGGGFGWGVLALAVVVLALDGLDGWLARRSGLRSRFGARFDVEADVIFALVMAALAVSAGKVGLWFLALGMLRPAFLLAGLLWPVLRAPLPDQRWRKVMAALQMSAQVALLAPLIAPPLSVVLGAGILGAMVLSFLVDIRWLIRHGTAPRRAAA